MNERPCDRFRRLRPLAPAVLSDGILRKRVCAGMTDEQCIAMPMTTSQAARLGGKARKRQMDAKGHIFHMFRRAGP